MATKTNAIATRENANAKLSGLYTSDLKRCVTYSSAISQPGLGVNNADRYVSNPNRLVRYTDLRVKFIAITLTVDVSSDPDLYNYGPLTLYPSNGATAQLPGMTLTKDSSPVNLLASMYGEQTVANKIVRYRILFKIFNTNDILGTYTLSYTTGQYPVRYFKNVDGQYPTGKLYNSSSSTAQSQSITISGEGNYVFNVYWKKETTSTKTFRLRLNFDRIQSGVYDMKLTFICTLYSGPSDGKVIGNGRVDGVTYNISRGALPSEVSNGSTYYYIDLWTGSTIPYYVKVNQINLTFRDEDSLDIWYNSLLFEKNRSYTGTNPALSGSGKSYYTLNPMTDIFTLDYEIDYD